jgi:DNA-directed RNA polymerase specialized sigma24 family protein
MQRDLVLRASKGDHDAFASLATNAYGRLHRTAQLILRREDLASDAVQQALTSAWLHIRAVRDPDRFDAWLNRLVVRACYTRHSKYAGRKSEGLVEARGDEQSLGTLMSRPRCPLRSRLRAPSAGYDTRPPDTQIKRERTRQAEGVLGL